MTNIYERKNDEKGTWAVEMDVHGVNVYTYHQDDTVEFTIENFDGTTTEFDIDIEVMREFIKKVDAMKGQTK